MHFIDSVWYIYVVVDDGDNHKHRMIVLRSEALAGPYEFVGKMELTPDRWAIDGTIFSRRERLYFAWSGWDGFKTVGGAHENLYPHV